MHGVSLNSIIYLFILNFTLNNVEIQTNKQKVKLAKLKTNKKFKIE
jgi:hypothetical protein